MAIFRLIIGHEGRKVKIILPPLFSVQSAFASAYFEEAPILGLGQGALSLIGLLSHALSNIYTITAVLLSASIQHLFPRTVIWMDNSRDTIRIKTRAYRYQISWPFRQVVNANCLYNGECHRCVYNSSRPSYIIVAYRALILPRCRPNPEFPATTKRVPHRMICRSIMTLTKLVRYSLREKLCLLKKTAVFSGRSISGKHNSASHGTIVADERQSPSNHESVVSFPVP